LIPTRSDPTGSPYGAVSERLSLMLSSNPLAGALAYVLSAKAHVVFPDLNVVRSSTFHVGDTKGVDMLAGTFRSGIRWTEACALRIDYRLDRLWLLIDPVVRRFDISEDTPQEAIEQSLEFVRERIASRRNKHVNAMIDGWAKLIAGDDKSLRLRTFEISDGYDGDFEIMRVSGFSGRA
jgi:hypothetical protein